LCFSGEAYQENKGCEKSEGCEECKRLTVSSGFTGYLACGCGTCASINDFDIKLINFNLIKINIKRMASEIPTNLLIISNFHLINTDTMYRYNLI
jgi:phage FluMu protein Com